MDRRRFVTLLAAGSALTAGAPLGGLAAVASGAEARAEARLAALERRIGGRLGVAALDTATGARVEHRPGERFPMCSTFKAPLVAAVLARVDRGDLTLTERIAYGAADLLPYAPVTRAHLREGALPIGTLCGAAVRLSDNTAANLLLRRIGGPPALTAFLRTTGDATTRCDRTEPTLNTAIPGDPRDTSTPRAFLATLRRTTTGDVLTRASRGRFVGWLDGCETGRARLRAGFPAGWRTGDKTGTGDHGTANDVAIARPVGRPPVFVVAFSTGANVSGAAHDAALAEVGRIVAAAFG